MATVNIFVSFQFSKDKDLQNSFYKQAEEYSHLNIVDCSLHESYSNQEWKDEAREAIRQSDVVIILIGEATHNAPGVKEEIKIARRLKKPVIQLQPQDRPQTGVPGVKKPIPWEWTRINQRLAALQASRSTTRTRRGPQ